VVVPLLSFSSPCYRFGGFGLPSGGNPLAGFGIRFGGGGNPFFGFFGFGFLSDIAFSLILQIINSERN